MSRITKLELGRLLRCLLWMTAMTAISVRTFAEGFRICNGHWDTTGRLRRISLLAASSSTFLTVRGEIDGKNTFLRSTSTDAAIVQPLESLTRKHRIVFLGTPDVAASTLQALFEATLQPNSNFEIAAVVTQPTKRRKRKGSPEPSAVGAVAEQLGLYTLTPEKANDAEFLDILVNDLQPDLCVTAAYGQYLPRRFLSTPRLGTINLHPSLLPKWRGAAPVQRSLEAGDPVLGVSILYTVAHMDAGPIIAQQIFKVDENDTATTVLPALFAVGTQLLLQSLPSLWSGSMSIDTAESQDDSLVVAANKIEASEAELKVWEESATTCHNRFRGFHMWPQTYLWIAVTSDNDSEKDGEPFQLKVLQSRVLPGPPVEATNIVRMGPTKKSGLHVICFDGSILELITVQPATRRAFPARDLQNGYPGATLRWTKGPADLSTYSSCKTDVSSSISC